MIYHFNEKNIPALSQIGGKAKALMETMNAGFPVPDGFVLPVEFFEEWMKTIKTSSTFIEILAKTSKDNCDQIQFMAEKLVFTNEQKLQVNEALKLIQGELFAIRSSSPEEDLEGTSFAGMYETYLGITIENVEKMVIKAFASCFDYRVMSYKQQNDLDLTGTNIAIIIQKQIDSDVSGVGFSLNPLNNCFDEVVINASYGLGEAIVSGIVTPDTYIYDAGSKKIIDIKVNLKERSLILKEDGGIQEKVIINKDGQALKDNQIVELSILIKKCEEYYKKPVDTEWAYEEGKLYLLQTRPITSYLPFFEELLTKPGAKKRFYMDIMIMTQGFETPMSVLGLELWADMLDKTKGGMLTPQVNGTTPAIYGREYVSFTDLQKLLGKKSVEKLISSYDGNVRKIMAEIDLSPHIPDQKPAGGKEFKWKMLKMLKDMLPGIMKGLFGNYKVVLENYNKVAEEVFLKARSLNKDDDFAYNAGQVSELLSEMMSTLSVMLSGMMAHGSIKKMFKDDDFEREIVALSMDLTGNPTSAMGQLLFKMACYQEFQNISSRDEFMTKCESRDFSQEYLDDFDEFMEKYAVRGMLEIDVASTRIYEDVGILYDKLVDINITDNQIEKVKDKRKAAYDKLLATAKLKGKEKKFIKAADKFQGIFGYREHPKYTIVYIFGMLHKMCLELSKEWVDQGRLDNVNQVFDLHVEEISMAQKDKSFDMMAAREKNLKGYRRVEHIKNWPLVIDSRGKIYKAKLEIKDGDIIGDPIAPGKVVGRAKVLHSPYEKPLNAGEILVTKATEPSWTPIFINAVGVIMEIGGPLQHGSIIAREYGIPCVSGVSGIMEMINDGDLIEVDGDHGIVKILDADK